MASLKKITIGVFAFIFLGVVGTWIYISAKTLTDFESLLLCSQGKDELVPKSMCQTYLFNFGGTHDEIAEINKGVGLGWVIRAENEDDRKKLVSFLINKGVNINGIDQRSGITALHAAVLENNQPNVNLLLSSGGDPSVRDQNRGQTPLELAIELRNRQDKIDRTAIIKLLENVAK